MTARAASALIISLVPSAFTVLWAETEMVLWQYTNFVDFYNILKFVTFDAYDRSYMKNRPFGKFSSPLPRENPLQINLDDTGTSDLFTFPS